MTVTRKDFQLLSYTKSNKLKRKLLKYFNHNKTVYDDTQIFRLETVK